MNKKPKKVEINPEDPNKDLWEWLLAGGLQDPEIREKQSRLAKQRSAEYQELRREGQLREQRERREAWLTDEQTLLTAEQHEP